METTGTSIRKSRPRIAYDPGESGMCTAVSAVGTDHSLARPKMAGRWEPRVHPEGQLYFQYKVRTIGQIKAQASPSDTVVELLHQRISI